MRGRRATPPPIPGAVWDLAGDRGAAGRRPLLDAGGRLLWHCDGNVMPIVPYLLDAGVSAVYGPGASLDEIVAGIRREVGSR